MNPKPLAVAVLCALAELRYGPRKSWNVWIDYRHGLEVKP